jgi:hypothetical protein
VLSIALTGYADRALPILLGETGRGKTQVVHLLMSVLGSYAHAANPKLLSSGSNEHDTIVFALKGRRLSFIDEAPREAKAGQERLKQLTGGGELTARQMNQDPITFRPTHTLVLTANDEPVLTDPAVRSRVRLIPCEGDPELVRTTRAAIGHVSGRPGGPRPRRAGQADGRGRGLAGRPDHAPTSPRRPSGSATWPSTSAPSRTRSRCGSRRRPSRSRRAPRAASSTRRSWPAACATTCAATRSPPRRSGAAALTRLGYPSAAHRARQAPAAPAPPLGGGFLPGQGPTTRAPEFIGPTPTEFLTG